MVHYVYADGERNLGERKIPNMSIVRKLFVELKQMFRYILTKNKYILPNTNFLVSLILLLD